MAVSASEIKERWEKCVKSVRHEVNEFRMNTCFLENEQWTFVNRETNAINEVARKDPDRVRMTINKLGPAERTIMGLLFARQLFFEVTPTAADDQTVTAANLAVQILDDYRIKQNWDVAREDLGQVSWRGGAGGLCLEWDPTAGEALPENDEPDAPTHTGDVRCEALSIDEFGVQPGARDAEFAHYWIKATAIPCDQAQADFGLAETPKADTTAAVTPWQRKGQADALRDLVTVYTYYERPHRGSDGEMTVMIAGEIVDTGAWPFPFTDRLNLFVSKASQSHGKWYGKTILSSARGPQVGLNQAHSSILEHMKNCGNARLFVDWSDFDRADEWTDTPGEIAGYNATTGQPPKYVGPGAMPNWWVSQPDRMSAVIDEMLGTTEVARGVAPRNVESGLGLSILSENSQSPLGYMAKESARVWGRFATCVLRTLAAKATETRSGSYVNNPGDLPEEFTWTGADLHEQTTALVPLEAVAPRSKAQAEAWATQLLVAGRIDERQYARLVDVPNQQETDDILDPNAAKQQRENRKMARGEECPVAPWDDHAKHIKVENDFCLSEAYERLSPDTQAIFDQHRLDHEAAAGADAAKDSFRQSVDPNLALAANAEQTPGSMPPGGPDGPVDDLDITGGSEPLGPGSEGLGGPTAGQGGGQLPPGGFPG